MAPQRFAEPAFGLADAGGAQRLLLGEGLGELAVALVELAHHLGAALGEVAGERLAGAAERGEALRDVAAGALQQLQRVGGGVAQRFRGAGAGALDKAGALGGGGGDGLAGARRAAFDGGDQPAALAGEARLHRTFGFLDPRGDAPAGLGDAAVELEPARHHRVEHPPAILGQPVIHALGVVADHVGDFAHRLRQRLGEFAAATGERFREHQARRP